MVKLKLPDGSKFEVKSSSSCLAAAKQLSEGLAKRALAAKMDGKLIDLSYKIDKDCKFELITFKSRDGQEIFRHSSSHVVALAVKRLFPKVKFAIGPAIEDGYYYDFDIDRSFTPDDLHKIEQEMKKIVAEKISFVRKEMSKEEALKLFKDEPYKIELIKDLPKGENISIYELGDFIDLCRGPHVPNSDYIKAFKLMKVAGAYWRGDSSKKMLQRIYGVSFPSNKELVEHLRLLEEAAKRDHRKLGAQLDLFSFHEEAAGMPFWHPKGWTLRNILVNFWRNEHQREGYLEVNTPIILNKSLWIQSGHWDHYKNNMYFTKIDDQDFAVKPMNCPGGMLLYKSKAWSYRDFPLKVGEIGLVHRHELSGVLSGLFRVRCFVQDDAHIFMTPDMIKQEIVSLIQFIDRIYKVFGFEYYVELSTRPDKFMGKKEDWDKAEASLQEAMDSINVKYKINPGDGAFYGPKIDFHVKDAIGRTWQCGTVQLDFQMPEKFDLEYTGEDGKKHRPAMLHRVIYGSLERFIGVLIEHFAGKFPLWLAPTQIRVLNIAERHKPYAEKIMEKLIEAGFRVEIDESSNTLQHKIREAQLQQINYMLILGDKEIENKKISVRSRDEKVEQDVDLDEFISRLENQIEQHQ